MIPRATGRCGDGSRDCGTFYLDFVGQFGPQQVDVHWSESRRHSNEQVDRQIDELVVISKGLSGGEEIIKDVPPALANGSAIVLQVAESKGGKGEVKGESGKGKKSQDKGATGKESVDKDATGKEAKP